MGAPGDGGESQSWWWWSGYIGSMVVPPALRKGRKVRVLDSLVYGDSGDPRSHPQPISSSSGRLQEHPDVVKASAGGVQCPSGGHRGRSACDLDKSRRWKSITLHTHDDRDRKGQRIERSCSPRAAALRRDRRSNGEHSPWNRYRSNGRRRWIPSARFWSRLRRLPPRILASPPCSAIRSAPRSTWSSICLRASFRRRCHHHLQRQAMASVSFMSGRLPRIDCGAGSRWAL